MEPKGQSNAILERQLHGLPSERSHKKGLLHYSTPLDKVILFISFACAISGGILNPLISVLSPFSVQTWLH
jgi:hypothetical protein